MRNLLDGETDLIDTGLRGDATQGTSELRRFSGALNPVTHDHNGWFKAMRTDDALELIRANPLAYVLASVIAQRARWRGGFSRHGLTRGEAMLGDHQNYGMSERQYRSAKAQLQKWKFATFKATNRGTTAKLMDTRLFSIIADQPDEQIDGDQTLERRTRDDQPTTKEEGIRKEKGRKEESLQKLTTKGPQAFANGQGQQQPRRRVAKLTDAQQTLADSAESLLGDEWPNDSGKWINRITGRGEIQNGKPEPERVGKVFGELKAMMLEGKVETTPARCAEDLWERFGSSPLKKT